MLRIDISWRLLLLCSIFGCTMAVAQENVSAVSKTDVMVMPLKKTAQHPWMIDLYATGGINTYSYDYLHTADEALVIGTQPELKALAWKLGLESFTYKNKKLQFGSGLGYKNVRFSFDGRSLSTNTGMHNHYLYADINAIYYFFGGGISVNRLLGTQTPREEKFEYVGLYHDCFNKWHAQWYVCYRLPVASFLIEARMMYSMTPEINPDKVSYYNQKKTSLYTNIEFEIKASYRIFTNRRKQEFYSLLDD